MAWIIGVAPPRSHISGRPRHRVANVECRQLVARHGAAGAKSMDLLERERCLAALAEWLASCGQQGGCIVLLAGEAGIGKTVLLEEFSRRQQAVRVLWGACDALFTPRPLAPLHDVAQQTQGALLAAV